MHIQIILGSVREGRRSGPIAQWALERASGRAGITAELIDLKTWDLPFYDLVTFPTDGDYKDPLQRRWGETIARADGYLFIVSEYNHGYTAVLKNALDYLYAEWNNKPASFIGFGNAEGARAVEQLRLVCIELGMAPLPSAVHLRNATKKIEGEVFKAEEAETKRFDVMFDEWLWWAKALRAARSAPA
jgi:NAD(P)H-dependent FMN reductase